MPPRQEGGRGRGGAGAVLREEWVAVRPMPGLTRRGTGRGEAACAPPVGAAVALATAASRDIEREDDDSLFIRRGVGG